jgi:hypothetical protein
MSGSMLKIPNRFVFLAVLALTLFIGGRGLADVYLEIGRAHV